MATIVNGEEDDPIDMKPFDKFFSKVMILRSWFKIGLVPFTRECLQNKKVRHKLGQKELNKDLEKLQEKYNGIVDELEESGFNPGIFDSQIPVARLVQRVDDEDEQVAQLVAQKSAFSASALWNICGTRFRNADVVIRAQKEQLAVEAAKVAQIKQKKEDAKVEKLVKARAALYKYHMNVNSLNTKDWGDLFRWVLPAAGVEVALKDYKKKEAMIAKLESLPDPWTSYIPPGNGNMEIADNNPNAAV